MNNAYTTPEVIEVGTAQEVILGTKGINSVDDPEGPQSSNDLDD
jgi:hypothetical protein